MTNTSSTIAYIDTDLGNALFDRITRVEGWVSSNDPIDSLEIYVNRRKLDFVDICERPDVPAATGRSHALGWNVYFETRSCLIGDLNTVLIEVAVNRRAVLRRYHRYEPRSKSTRPTIYFMHIPKTAGCSTRRALEGDKDIRLLPVYHQYPCIQEGQIATFSDAALDDVDIVYGHYMYGIHRYSGRPHKYVSLVREPIEHVISCYLYMKYVTRDERVAPRSSIFEAFDVVDDLTFDNYITRHIAGYTAPPKVGPAEFEAAVSNIDSHFAYIGTVERYKESLEAISFYLGKELPHHVDNVTPISEEAKAIDRDEVRDRLGPRLAYDLTLYQAIRDRFPAGFFFDGRQDLLVG